MPSSFCQCVSGVISRVIQMRRDPKVSTAPITSDRMLAKRLAETWREEADSAANISRSAAAVAGVEARLMSALFDRTRNADSVSRRAVPARWTSTRAITSASETGRVPLKTSELGSELSAVSVIGKLLSGQRWSREDRCGPEAHFG